MNRSKWKTQFVVIDGNSKFHEKVRAILVSDTWLKALRAYQEVPVDSLIGSYPSSRHRYDWYIEDLNLIIELHGQQHYKRTNRGNVGYEQSVRDFRSLQARDRQKKQAAIDAGFRYLEIPYKEYSKLTTTRFKALILED